MTRGRAGHVVLHLLHAVGGLDGDAAGIERDALPDQGQMIRLRSACAGLYFRTIRNGGLAAALRNAEQSAHSQLLHRVAIEHFALQAVGRRHRSGLFRQNGGRQLVSRLIRPDRGSKFCASPIIRPASKAPVSCSAFSADDREAVICFSFFLGSVLYLSGSQPPASAPSATAAVMPRSRTRVERKRNRFHAFRFRALHQHAAMRRDSTVENVLALPPPITTSRLAGIAFGRCRVADS